MLRNKQYLFWLAHDLSTASSFGFCNSFFYQLKHIIDIVQQGVNFIWSSEDFVALEDNML
jgi:hypothetical protein